MPTVGELLKNERERQGLELKDIENAISIRVLYLNAIEEGNYSVIPGEVYLKGFIRNYAIQLGLDPQEALNVYYQSKSASSLNGMETEEDFNGKGFNEDDFDIENPRIPSLQASNPISGKTSLQAKRLERRRDKKKKEKTGSGSKRVAVLVIAILVIGAAVWQATDNFNFSSSPAPSPAAQSETNSSVQPNSLNPDSNAVTEHTTPPPTQQPPISPEPNAAPVPDKDVVVVAKFSNQCWIQVNIDGKLEYEGIPKIGEALTFSGNQKIFIKLGNAGAVNLTHNGKELGVAGKPGDVVIKTFAKDAVSTVDLR